MNRKRCLIVCGPTAVGKTDISIDLALKYNTSIISADSRQCYKELNIGVAKPSTHQLESVPHYFINSHSIRQEINVKLFETYALNAVAEIFQENDVAVMVGGTGMYIKVFAEGIDDVPETNKEIRERIINSYEEHGIEWLQQELKLHDPEFYSEGEMQNPQRMLRALEVKNSTGKSILDFQSNQKNQRDFEVEYMLLELPRETLYQRINHRVDIMMEEGLLEEVKSLFPFRHLNALQTVGYRELFDYIEGKHSLETAVEEIKKNTRRYAKRQMTWFKKYAGN
ncbi:MAG: tRNA (adenosine(37)-N6)-dimethylallyltransferase MiaA [Ginsengibacter sp.]